MTQDDDISSVADLAPKPTGMPAFLTEQQQHTSLNRTTESKKEFAVSYIKDFSLSMTATRCGMSLEQALEYVEDTECAAIIDELVANTKFSDLISRNKIVAGLMREANHESGKGSHTARINAWDKLAKILKMYEGEKAGTVINGGVMIVPVIQGQKQEDAVTAWENDALPAQTELLEVVRTSA